MCVKPNSFTYGMSCSASSRYGQERLPSSGDAPPRAEVHFVDRTSGASSQRVAAPARRHPLLVAPLVARDVADDGRRLRRRFEGDAERVGLRQQRAGRRADLELVPFAVGEIGNEDLPDAAGHEQPHRVDASVPAVEVADDADALGVGRPDGEVHAGGRAQRRMRCAPSFSKIAWCVPSPKRCRSKSVRTRPYRYGSSNLALMTVARTSRAGGSRVPGRFPPRSPRGLPTAPRDSREPSAPSRSAAINRDGHGPCGRLHRAKNDGAGARRRADRGRRTGRGRASQAFYRSGRSGRSGGPAGKQTSARAGSSEVRVNSYGRRSAEAVGGGGRSAERMDLEPNNPACPAGGVVACRPRRDARKPARYRGGTRDGELVVHLQCAPIDNAANEELIERLAEDPSRSRGAVGRDRVRRALAEQTGAGDRRRRSRPPGHAWVSIPPDPPDLRRPSLTSRSSPSSRSPASESPSPDTRCLRR